MPSEPFILKYHFGVLYNDGDEFYQNDADDSALKPGGSAFSDVQQDEVQLFQLADAEHNRFLVDLRDGHFDINGQTFFAQIPPPGAKLRLIYFRRRRIHWNLAGEEIGQECEYHFGWQTTHEGKNYQQTIILI